MSTITSVLTPPSAKNDHTNVAGHRNSLAILAVAILCALFDGFDLQVLAFVASTIAQSWQVGLPAFGIAFSAGIAGMILGGLFVAPLGDRVGRKSLVIGAMLAVAMTTFVTGFCTNIAQLAAIRFFTGVGLGAIMPGLIAIAHESAPPARRTVYVTILMCGFPAGGFFGGLIVAAGLRRVGWEALFMGMGVVALGITLLMAVVLVGGRPVQSTKRKLPSGLSLLRDGRAVPTLLIWLLYFASLFNIYLLMSWLPSLLERSGFSNEQAAMVSGINSLGGAIGGIVLGYLVGKLGKRILLVAYLLAVPAVAAMGAISGALNLMFCLSFLVGALIPGGHVCNTAIVADHYATEMRATGLGWAQSIGRFGSILAPVLVAIALQFGWTNQAIFGIAAVSALISAGALAGLAIASAKARSSRNGGQVII